MKLTPDQIAMMDQAHAAARRDFEDAVAETATIVAEYGVHIASVVLMNTVEDWSETAQRAFATFGILDAAQRKVEAERAR